MGSVVDTADRLWRGELDVRDAHPFAVLGEVEEVTDGVAFVPSFANVSVLRTDDGVVLVDTGSAPLAAHVHGQVRRYDGGRLHTAVYSHGHIDHVFGVPLFAQEARDNGWPAPRVVAHEALPRRFDRYVLTAGYNEVVNQRQFQLPGLRWPVEYRYPDQTYRDRLSLDVGGLALRLTHCRGETDDHTWTWVPDRKVLCCGDQRDGRAARAPARRDGGENERRRPARRDRAVRAGAPSTCSTGRTCGRCTTSPSSSSATCGGSTAAGTTATRHI